MPAWNNTTAGTIFEQMLTQTDNEIDGVLAANDGLGNAVITMLKKNGLNGKVPVTGQDADVQALQNILVGDQCMTVYKAVKEEADAAAELAIALSKGERKDVPGRSRTRRRTARFRPCCSPPSRSSSTRSRTWSRTAT